ncbi:dephospho-CoA kinase [Rhizobium sp. C4]|uniref:dephospho-CoA kinase n=1 Tax=Rhizobium sp. C4 TaxID=1349800 RepID=UPI001E2B785B|nr:dephospho-CoA kinase [Rhizobium sp. C4]MCD2174692.1 dephospho-CoA kinase [Rhizobium sp. C4]
MFVLGLTGSIGMGKSTTADMFRAEGIPVNDADAVVHALYAAEAVAPIEAAFPGTTADGKVDRTKLAAHLAAHPADFKTLEAIVHPLARSKELQFRETSIADGHDIAVLDIPLLFETGGEGRVDAVVVVTCAPEIQRARVLARPGMTVDKFEMILSRQLPDSEKRARADYIVETGEGLEKARAQVRDILADIRARRLT